MEALDKEGGSTDEETRSSVQGELDGGHKDNCWCDVHAAVREPECTSNHATLKTASGCTAIAAWVQLMGVKDLTQVASVVLGWHMARGRLGGESSASRRMLPRPSSQLAGWLSSSQATCTTCWWVQPWIGCQSGIDWCLHRWRFMSTIA